MTVHVIMKL